MKISVNTIIVLVIIALIIILAYKYQNEKMNSFSDVWSMDIEADTIANENWRHVVDPGFSHLQPALMSIPVGMELGWEAHKDSDQFFRVEAGQGELRTGSPDSFDITPFSDGIAAIVPSGMLHNVVNTGPDALKMYVLYSPPHHKPGLIDVTKADEIARH